MADLRSSSVDPAAPAQTKRPPAKCSPGAAFALSFLFRKSAQDLSDVAVDADRLLGDLRQAGCLPAIDAGIDGVLVFGRHLPKGIFDDDRRVVADARFKKQDLLSAAGAQEIFVSFCCPVPALVLDEFVVGAQVHRHRPPAVRADRQQICRDQPVFPPRDHRADRGLVVKSFLTARPAAPEQAVIALRVEQPLFVEPRLLEAVIHVGRDHEIVLVGHQRQKGIIHRFRRVRVAVDENYRLQYAQCSCGVENG